MAEEDEKGKEESSPLQGAYLARIVMREHHFIHDNLLNQINNL